jgi:hypothetical protein
MTSLDEHIALSIYTIYCSHLLMYIIAFYIGVFLDRVFLALFWLFEHIDWLAYRNLKDI